MLETKVTDMMNCAQDRETGLCSPKSRK